jgi:hypothetical protein
MDDPRRPARDEFLSEEDLDLKSLSDEELSAWWGLWFEMAQGSNERDARYYSHGVFDVEPPWEEGEPRDRFVL